MALTRDFKVTIQESVLTDPEFRVGLLTQAAECLLDNEIDVAKALLRDYVNATLGFKQLGALMGKKPQSLCSVTMATRVSATFLSWFHHFTKMKG